MTLSLWILSDWLKDLVLDIKCRKKDPDITEIRLKEPPEHPEASHLYISRDETGRHVICKNEADWLLLNTDRVEEAANRILEAFCFYAKWNEECAGLLSCQCTLADLLDKAAEIFRVPVLMIDAYQTLIAFSSNAENYSDSPQWQAMLQNMSADPESIKAFNLAFRQKPPTEEVEIIPEGFFPTAGYQKYLTDQGEMIATIVLVDPDLHFRKGDLQLLSLFSDHVKRWIRSSRDIDSSAYNTSVLARFLDGSPDTEEPLRRYLKVSGWNADTPMQLYILKSISAGIRFDSHLCSMLHNIYKGIYCIPYQQSIAILLNLELTDAAAFRKRLDAYLVRDGYTGVYGTAVQELKSLLGQYRQAAFALEQSGRKAGILNCIEETTMEYLSSYIRQNLPELSFHPQVRKMLEYDSRHHTEYTKTLFVYLKNNQDNKPAAQELYIHRNTLLQRLNKIKELWNPDLKDNDNRFYLLFSLYHLFLRSNEASGHASMAVCRMPQGSNTPPIGA